MIVGTKFAMVNARKVPEEFKGPHKVSISYHADGWVEVKKSIDTEDSGHFFSEIDFWETFDVVEWIKE